MTAARNSNSVHSIHQPEQSDVSLLIRISFESCLSVEMLYMKDTLLVCRNGPPGLLHFALGAFIMLNTEIQNSMPVHIRLTFVYGCCR